MPYTRPDFDAADATFDGLAAYTLPDFDEADASFFEGTPEALIAIPGPLGAVAVMAEATAACYISIPGPLGAVQVMAAATVAGYISIAGPLGAVQVMVSLPTKVVLSVPGPLGAVLVMGHADFSSALNDAASSTYVLDLVTPSGNVRVPMSSFQATLQVVDASYAGAVIPHCAEWLDTLEVTTEFIVSRRSTLTVGLDIEQEIARAPVDTLQIDQGPTNHTASISGYVADAYEAVEDPDARYDRTLRGVRSISTYSSGVRVRCSIDWLLRPGQRAFYDATSMVVSYMNLYVTLNTTSIEAYMDVGERL